MFLFQACTITEERRTVRIQSTWVVPAGHPEHEADVSGGSAGARRSQRVQHAVSLGVVQLLWFVLSNPGLRYFLG